MAGRNEVDKYIAVGGLGPSASAAAIQSAYGIEVRFLGGLTTAQKNAFKRAADRWSKVITGDVPSVLVGGEVIDDIVIEAQGAAIDGPGGIPGQAGPTSCVRPLGPRARSCRQRESCPSTLLTWCRWKRMERWST